MGLTDDLEQLAATAAGPDLARRLRFVAELDRLRLVERRTYIAGGTRLEDSASHSWHVATMALALAPFLGDGFDIDRVVRMLLVHDIVEIDAGDVAVYDVAARLAKAEEEQRAAVRLFGLLPDGTGGELLDLWHEFEAKATPEARVASALDRLAPMLLNWLAAGRTWRDLGVHAGQVRQVNVPVAAAVSHELAAVVAALIDDAIARGWLADDPSAG